MRQKLRTCLLTHEYPPMPGGVGVSVRRIARLLSSHGHEVHVALFKCAKTPVVVGENLHEYLDGEIRVHEISFSPGVPIPSDSITRPEKEFSSYHASIEMFLGLQSLHRKNHFDIVHGFFLSNVGQILCLLGKTEKVPTVASIRGNDIGKNIFLNEHLPRLKFTLENADVVTSVSLDLLVAARAVHPFKNGIVVNNSFDQERLSRIEATPRPSEGAIIGMVGIYRFKKGLPLLLAALERVKFQGAWTLLLVGDYQNEREREYHRPYIEQCSFRERIHFTGFIRSEAVLGYLKHMDVFVAPSLFSEGCPNAVLEAMALGLPIVASDAGGIPEILHHEETALLYPQADIDLLATHIQRLLENREYARGLGTAARESLQHHSIEREGEEWERVYALALGKK